MGKSRTIAFLSTSLSFVSRKSLKITKIYNKLRQTNLDFLGDEHNDVERFVSGVQNVRIEFALPAGHEHQFAELGADCAQRLK